MLIITISKECRMIVAIATNDKVNIADRFGRGAGFMFIDTETGEKKYIDNTANASIGHGAGVQTSKLVAEADAQAAIGPHFGPSAFGTLQMAGVRVFHGTGNIDKAIEDFKSGVLEEVVQSNVQSHHGNCKYK